MEEGKVVLTGKTKKGRDIIIRYIKTGDTEKMHEYINSLSQERTFLMYQGEEITLEDEEKYLNDHLDKLKEGKLVHLLAFDGAKLIGGSEVIMNSKIGKHTGVFGLSVSNKYRGEGVGKILMENVLKEAKENLEELKIIILQVFEKNCIAKNLYKKMGFIEYGKLPEGIFRNGEYEDEVYMYKKIR